MIHENPCTILWVVLDLDSC